MEDIEDLGASLDGMEPDETASRYREGVTLRHRTGGGGSGRTISGRNKVAAAEGRPQASAAAAAAASGASASTSSSDSLVTTAPQLAEAAVPGIGVVWMKTWGCSHNVSDGEYMGGQLAAFGFDVTEDDDRRESADLWLLNSCTVKDPSQAAFVNLLKAARREDRLSGGKKGGRMPLVLAGCVPQAERNLASLRGLGDGVSLVGVAQLERIVEVVQRTMRGECVRALSKRTPAGNALPALDLPKMRRNPLVEIVPLSTGCLGACTYCKTVHARGKLGSYHPDAIVKRIAQAVQAEGVTEVWLSSEDTGAYGIDLGTSFSQLLGRILAPDGPLAGTRVMLRLGMTNPPYMHDQMGAITAALAHPNVFAFLHVPVQAGSDAVLKAMNREYTRAEFDAVADALFEAFPAAAPPGAEPAGRDGDGDGDDEDGAAAGAVAAAAAGGAAAAGAGGSTSGGGSLGDSWELVAQAKKDDGAGQAEAKDDDDDDDGFTLATDVICGFPGETDEDFQDTASLVDKYRFPVLNISQFYARPGTPAAKMRPRVPNGVAKERTRALTKYLEGLWPHARLVGRTVTVWCNTETATLKKKTKKTKKTKTNGSGEEGEGGEGEGGEGEVEEEEATVGHTKSYVKVLLPYAPELVGAVCRAQVTAAARWHVEAVVLALEPANPRRAELAASPAAAAATAAAASSSPPSSSCGGGGRDHGSCGGGGRGGCGGGCGGGEGGCGVEGGAVDASGPCCGGGSGGGTCGGEGACGGTGVEPEKEGSAAVQ